MESRMKKVKPTILIMRVMKVKIREILNLKTVWSKKMVRQKIENYLSIWFSMIKVKIQNH